MKKINNISLLQDISSQEIDELIFEHRLEKEGYKFFYFIDNYDINKYTFPFGLIPSMDLDDRKKLPIEVITDEQLAYNFLIRKEKQLLLFNEHIEEVNNYISKVKWIEYYSKNIINTSDEFIKYFEDKKKKYFDFDDLKELNNFFYSDNVSLLISIALGLLYDGKQKLKNLIEKNLISDINKLNKNIYDTEIIEECEPNIETEMLFEKLKEDFKVDSLNRLTSRYDKCKIYNRLLCINRKSRNNKHLYYLVSSSKTTSERLPYIANYLGLSFSIKKRSFKPVKTIAQIYVQLLLSNNKDKIDYLKELKEIIKFKENSTDKSIKEEANKLLIYRFEQKTSFLRENFENSSLLLNFHNYHNDIKMILHKNILTDNKDIIIALKELIDLSKNKEELKRAQSISISEIKYLRSYSIILKSALEDIEVGKGYLSGFSGLDYIDSPYHSLPFVFFNKTDSSFNTILDEIVSLVTESHLGKITSSKLINSIKNSFNLLFHKPITITTDEEKVIMLLTLLLLKRENEFKPNEIAYNWLSEIINKKIYNENWYLDFIYIQSWLARRIKKYNEAIEIANIGIKKDKDDPRFYQSLYLNYYCLFENTNVYNYLEKAIENCHKSYKKFIIYEENKSVKKAIAAILNSLSFLYTIKYEKKKRTDDIIQARTFLEILKKECDDYIHSPEFNHTESFLEWNEYIAFKDKQKLHYALKRIERAISILDKKDYFDLKTRIINELNTPGISC